MIHVSRKSGFYKKKNLGCVIGTYERTKSGNWGWILVLPTSVPGTEVSRNIRRKQFTHLDSQPWTCGRLRWQSRADKRENTLGYESLAYWGRNVNVWKVLGSKANRNSTRARLRKIEENVSFSAHQKFIFSKLQLQGFVSQNHHFKIYLILLHLWSLTILSYNLAKSEENVFPLAHGWAVWGGCIQHHHLGYYTSTHIHVIANKVFWTEQNLQSRLKFDAISCTLRITMCDRREEWSNRKHLISPDKTRVVFLFCFSENLQYWIWMCVQSHAQYQDTVESLSFFCLRVGPILIATAEGLRDKWSLRQWFKEWRAHILI